MEQNEIAPCMTRDKKNIDKTTGTKKANEETIKKLKNKMKHQKDALNKILKTIQNEGKSDE